MKKLEMITHTTLEEVETKRCDHCSVSEAEFFQMRLHRNWHERVQQLPGYNIMRRTETLDFCSYTCEAHWLNRYAAKIETELNKPWDDEIAELGRRAAQN